MRARSWFALGISLLSAFGATASATAAEPRDDVRMRGLHKSIYLHVAGSRLVTAGGAGVVLRGVNVGGWLVTEGWMCGLVDARDTLAANGAAGVAGRSTLESLEERFGAADAAALMAVWQDNWITGADLDAIRATGFNVVRVPIGWRTLQHADGSWILDARGRIDFARMDWIVREAGARGLYTIFDLHVWPGQRTAYEKIGRPDGAAIREAMAGLWTAIAAHYRGNGAIAAFDLVNEFPGAWGLQQRLAQAVRTGDPDRVQIVEGFTFPEYLKLHAAGTFPNGVFSDHFYGPAPLSTQAIEERLRATAGSPVPVYIGEFLAADFASATRAMDRAQASWSSWTWKTVDMGQWGVFDYPATVTSDVQADSYQTLAARWSTPLASRRYTSQIPNYRVNDPTAADTPPS